MPRLPRFNPQSADPYAAYNKYYGDVAKEMGHMPGTPYFYVLGTASGKLVSGESTDKTLILGPYLSELDATEHAKQLDDYEIFTLMTRNLSAATKQIKHEIAQRGQSGGKFGDTAVGATQPKGHKIPLPRFGKKKKPRITPL